MTCYPVPMEDNSSLSATDRIDRALTRIEAALDGRSTGDLARRHAALKKRTAEALAALDDILDRAKDG